MTFPIPDLTGPLHALLAQIPRGRVTTYGRLADGLGSRKAARWIGEILARPHAALCPTASHLQTDIMATSGPHGLDCPCHRVVRADGTLGLYVTGDPQEKRQRLEAEGVPTEQGRVDLSRHEFQNFTPSSPAPLRTLLEYQDQLSQRISRQGELIAPVTIAGVDVSYGNRQTGTAAYVLHDFASGELLWQTTATAPVPFPYIPGFLTFRELPLLLNVWERACEAGHGADVILVDGNGILHPRGAGIAASFGVETGAVTIGVAKSLLCGTVGPRSADPREPWAEVRLKGEVAGAALFASPQDAPSCYVSPGHRISVGEAARLVSLTLFDERLPRPIRAADRLSRSTGRISSRKV